MIRTRHIRSDLSDRAWYDMVATMPSVELEAMLPLLNGHVDKFQRRANYVRTILNLNLTPPTEGTPA
jgi:hypothetical protein